MKYINFNKLDSIKLNKKNFYVLIDFDGTLTKGNSISAWRVLYYSNLLGDDFKQKYDEIHAKTLPNENESDQIKQQAFEIRFKEFFKLLKERNLNDKIIKEAVKKTDLQLRDGAREFLKKMNEINVPVIIISSSIKNVIKEYLQFNKCYYDNIYLYSNFFDIEGKGQNNIYNVTPYNKNQISFSEDLKNKIESKKYILLLGDIVDDVNMVVKEKLEDTITVGFLDKEIEQNLEIYKSTFDIVLTDNSSFEELNEILHI